MIIFLSLAFSLGHPYTCYEIFPVASLGILLLDSFPVFVMLACKLRKYPSDGRYLRTEFRSVSLVVFFSKIACFLKYIFKSCFLPHCHCAGILTFIAIKLLTPEEYSGNYFLSMAVVGGSGSNCLLPVILSFRYNKFVISRAKSLDELLATPTGVQSFLVLV